MKAAPEGVAMVIRAIRPAGAGLMDFYRSNITGCNEIADGFGWPKFSNLCKRDLAAYGLDPQAIDLIESVTRVGNFADLKHHLAERKRHARMLFATDGIRQKRGKRTRPGVLEFVKELTPVLVFYGFEFKTGDRARLATVLRIIADEIGLSGDPREELRRLKRCADTDRSRLYGILADAIAPRPRVSASATRNNE